jgi:hypothetical protein
MLAMLAEARAPKGTPTSLNVWVMFNSLEKGGGVISDRVEPTHLSHLRKCLGAGFLERGASGGFVPTQKGIDAMEQELSFQMSRDPSYKRPAWMGSEYIASVSSTQIYENYNRDILNQLLAKIQQWRQSRRTGSKQDFSYDQKEIEEVKNVVNLSKQKCLDKLNNHFSKEWKQYLVWEKNLTDQNLLFGHDANLSGMGPRYKIGNFDFNSPDTVVVSEDFYNLLMYREIIKSLEKSIKDNHQVNVLRVDTALRRLAGLFK